MTDKTPKWMTAAAKELVGVIFKGYAVRSDYNGYEIVATIISKHCPDDKGAEKLVDVLKEIRDMAGTALADYEKLNK